MSESLNSHLPYWEFVQGPPDHAILWDGSLCAGIEIVPADIDCADEATINRLTMQTRGLLNSLPEGLTVQFVVQSSPAFHGVLDSHRTLRTTEHSFLCGLDEERAADLETKISRGALLANRIYCFLKTSAPASRAGRLGFVSAGKFAQDMSREYEARFQELAQALESLESTIYSLGIATSRVSRHSIVQLCYEALNPRRAKTFTAPEVKNQSDEISADSPRNQLCLSDVTLGRDDFTIDGERTRVLSLKSLPEASVAGMMNGFLDLPFAHAVTLTVYVPDQAKEMRSLEQRRRMAHSLSFNTGRRVNDLESESRLSQTSDLIRELIETGQRIYHAELLVTLHQPDTPEGLKHLNRETLEVLGRFRSLSGAEGVRETVAGWKIFENSLPAAPMKLIRSKKIKTNNLADLIPIYGPARGDEDRPIVLTENRRGSLFAHDSFSHRLTNFNMLTTGSSGSGKSFANNYFLLQEIARGVRAFIIDIGGSYRKMTEVLGGQYIEMDLSGSYTMNPLALPDPRLPPAAEKLKSLVSIIEQMVSEDAVSLSRLDRVLIEETLSETFARAREAEPARSPLLSDFHARCNTSPEPGLNRLAKLLRPWIGDSPYGRILDRAGSLQTDRSVVAFDLKGLSQHPDLQSVLILILTGYLLDEVERDKTAFKRIIMDEAWQFLKSRAAANFTEYAARTFRKTGSGITFITQGLDELVASLSGAPILNCTATKLIMMQQGDLRIFQDLLKLNGQEVRCLESLARRKGHYSEGLFLAGDTHQVIRITPSPLQYWICTSDPADNYHLAKLTEAEGSLEPAIVRAACEAPFGVLTLPGGAGL